jgi:hypothetical protein
MHHMTHISHKMQKYKFSVPCPGALFVKSEQVLFKHESASTFGTPDAPGMHYVTRRSHRMQKHKFGITYPSAIFMETTQGLPENEK